MYDINLKNVKKGKSFYNIFLIVGIISLGIILAVLIGTSIKSNKMDRETMSKSVTISTHYDDEGSIMYSPIYTYEVKGVTYVCKSTSSSSIRPSETNEKVKYNSNNPSECMTKYDEKLNWIIYIFFIIPAVFLTVAIIGIRKVNKRIKIINELNRTGKLVKNIPYRMINSNHYVNGVPLQIPEIDYTLPSGSIIKLRGDIRHDKKTMDEDGMVDLLIDEQNPENYFIDFEINRLLGNSPDDYYKENKVENNKEWCPPGIK